MEFPWESITKEYYDLSLCHIIDDEFDPRPLITDLRKVEEHYPFLQHPTSYSNGGFMVLPLRNNTGSYYISNKNNFDAPTSDRGMGYTEVAGLTNWTIPYVESFNIKFYQVRYFGLRPGGIITHHADYPKDESARKIARINIPLRTNNKSFIRLGHETHQLHLGKVYWVESHVPHCSINMGDEFRVILAIDFDFYGFMNSKYSPTGLLEERMEMGKRSRQAAVDFAKTGKFILPSFGE
mgnify:CR=1 FL=1